MGGRGYAATRKPLLQEGPVVVAGESDTLMMSLPEVLEVLLSEQQTLEHLRWDKATGCWVGVAGVDMSSPSVELLGLVLGFTELGWGRLVSAVVTAALQVAMP
jgi:hypothetical protein